MLNAGSKVTFLVSSFLSCADNLKQKCYEIKQELADNPGILLRTSFTYSKDSETEKLLRKIFIEEPRHTESYTVESRPTRSVPYYNQLCKYS